MNNPYIISIGSNCNVAITLRKMLFRTFSYPFDWARLPNIMEIVDIIKNKDNFDVSKWLQMKFKHNELPHDVPNDSHGIFENEFENCDTTLEKYKRRFNRFFEHLYSDRPVYLIRYEDSNGLNELKRILPPNCHVIFIKDGSPDSLDTINQIKNITKFEIDPYSIILQGIMNNIDLFPLSYNDILQSVLQINKDITNFVDGLFPDKTIIWKKDELFAYLYVKLKELTGKDYAIL
jgi:hypothetical protein